MQRLTLNAIFLIAHCALLTGARAENTYKCGDNYSQMPCTGAVLVDAADPRTNAQKAQTDLATGRNARTADAMEKARLKQASMDLAANTPAAQAVNTDAAIPPDTAQAKKKKKKKEPDYFTAQVPGEKKIKKAPKKSSKKSESKS